MKLSSQYGFQDSDGGFQKGRSRLIPLRKLEQWRIKILRRPTPFHTSFIRVGFKPFISNGKWKSQVAAWPLAIGHLSQKVLLWEGALNWFIPSSFASSLLKQLCCCFQSILKGVSHKLMAAFYGAINQVAGFQDNAATERLRRSDFLCNLVAGYWSNFSPRSSEIREIQ